MNQEKLREAVANGETSLGIEFGSTRIKAVLIDRAFNAIATGSYEWENQLKDGYWTYDQEDIIAGMQTAYREMKREVQDRFGITLSKVGSIGFSAMMHGYMAFDDQGRLPFRSAHGGTRRPVKLQGNSRKCSSSTFLSGGASRTCIKRS